VTTPPVAAPQEPDVSLPLWLVLVFGLVLVTLATFAMVFAMKLGRSRPTTAPLDAGDE